MIGRPTASGLGLAILPWPLLGLGLGLGLGGAGVTGCADAHIIDHLDFGTNSDGGDGGASSTRFGASESSIGLIQGEAPAGAADFQHCKRDPSYVFDGTDQYVYYAGSANFVAPPNPPELWKLAFFTVPGSTYPQTWPLAAKAAVKFDAT